MWRAQVLILMLGWCALIAGSAFATPAIPDAKLRQRMDELAASTLIGGAGWRTYDKLLHPGYSRWAMGEAYEDREKFVRGLQEWWDYGMRVSKRDIEMVGVDVAGNVATIRFLTRETFVGPDKETGG